MNIKLFIYTILFMMALKVQANESAVIHGKILSSSISKIIISFYEDETRLVKSNVAFEVNEYGEFESELLIAKSQLVILEYSGNRKSIYIDPGERIGVLIDPSDEITPVKYFEQDGELDNWVYGNYLKLFGEKNVVISNDVALSKKLYNDLKDLDDQNKFDLLTERNLKEQSFYDQLVGEKVSNNFLNLLNSEIRNSYLSCLLITVNRDNLRLEDQEQFSQTINRNLKPTVQNVNDIFYQGFLKSYSLFNCEERLKKTLDYYKDVTDVYACIKGIDELNTLSKELILGQLLYRNIKPNRVAELTEIYTDYSNTATNTKIIEVLKNRYELAQSLKGGQKVPDCVLVDDLGQQFSLRDFKGKMTYVMFWAKWCGACKEEIMETNELRKRMKDEPINFVLISIDEDKQTWQDHGITNSQFGIHLWGGFNKDELMTNFGISSLPKNILIDKEGGMIINFPKLGDESFFDFMNENY